MARRKRSKSKRSCGCPKGSVKKSIRKVGARCVKKLANGRWRFVKAKC